VSILRNTCALRGNRLVPFWAGVLLCFAAEQSPGAEGPFFITYTHQMEEPGNLEVAVKGVSGNPGGTGRFWATAVEFEYGVKGWWTTSVYLDGQTTRGDSTLFTGYRWENRFRLLPREHWINPVLYLEFENINNADKSLLDIVSTDGEGDLVGSNAGNRSGKKRELEAKLILSSHIKGWTIAENFIAEKNVRHAPYEFGYAVGVSHPLALAARAETCQLCPENFQVGVEMYGGLGTHESFGLHDTSHYIAPTLAWTSSPGITVRFSPGFGVTSGSAPFLLRVGVSYEISQFGRRAHHLLGQTGGRQ
jgi:hypothetical protein